MTAKVLLCQPPLHAAPNVFLPEGVQTRLSCFPSLGLLSVRAGLKRRAGIHADYLDAEALGLNISQAARRIVEAGPRIVGLTMDSFTLPTAVGLAREIKNLSPDAIVAAGGVHPTIYPGETAALDCVDWAFCGEADLSFADAVLAWSDHGEPDVAGLAYRKDGQIVLTGPADPIEDLDVLPMPDRSGLPVGRYFSATSGRRPVLSLITSRGCPFSCTFCDRPVLARGLRVRSAELVVTEMIELKGMGAAEASFYDENFAADKRRAREIAEMLAGKGALIPFDIRSRVDTMDTEMIEALAAAGCRRIYFGVESGDTAVLAGISKGIDLKGAAEVFKTARRCGIKRLAYFMFGLPGEDEHAARRTIDFARSLRADFYLFEVFIPMPATRAYMDALDAGLITSDYWAEQAADPKPHFVPPPYPGLMSQQRLREINREAYVRTTLRPGFILRSLLDVRRPSDLAMRIKTAVGLLRRGG